MGYNGLFLGYNVVFLGYIRVFLGYVGRRRFSWDLESKVEYNFIEME